MTSSTAIADSVARTSYTFICEGCDQEWNIMVASMAQIPSTVPCPACKMACEVSHLPSLGGEALRGLGARLEAEMGNVLVDYSGLIQCRNTKEEHLHESLVGMIVPTGDGHIDDINRVHPLLVRFTGARADEYAYFDHPKQKRR